MTTVTVTSPDTISVTTDAVQGPTGATGPTGPQGPQGPAGADGADGVGVPAGGTQGQVLAKATSTDYDTEWIEPSNGDPVEARRLAIGLGSRADRTIAWEDFGQYSVGEAGDLLHGKTMSSGQTWEQLAAAPGPIRNFTLRHDSGKIYGSGSGTATPGGTAPQIVHPVAILPATAMGIRCSARCTVQAGYAVCPLVIDADNMLFAATSVTTMYLYEIVAGVATVLASINVSTGSYRPGYGGILTAQLVLGNGALGFRAASHFTEVWHAIPNTDPAYPTWVDALTTNGFKAGFRGIVQTFAWDSYFCEYV